MEHSEALDQLAPALAEAQSEMAGAKKESDNPFFKSKYADLTSVWQACKEALHSNGFSVIQHPVSSAGRVGVTTMLLHESGQWVRDSFTLGVKKPDDPQADGSSITYARRYSLAAMVGVCPVDDDAEGAMDRENKKESPKQFPQKAVKVGHRAGEARPPDAATIRKQIIEKGGSIGLDKDETARVVQWYQKGDTLKMKEGIALRDDFDTQYALYVADAENETMSDLTGGPGPDDVPL